jgi:hypothetical protein
MPNLVGIGNSQVPTNAMLGGLAYQDSVGEINLEKIKARTADTAVAPFGIFVYDTSKDSDGGAWRKTTQSTSWYNEGVSEYRGDRKEFPSIAVIVVESDHLKIYDGDDPNMSMWMIFKNQGQVGAASNMLTAGVSGQTNTCVHALNGEMVVGVNRTAGSSEGLFRINFISERAIIYRTEASGYTASRWTGNIKDRNYLTIGSSQMASNCIAYWEDNDLEDIRDLRIKDVSMVVERNAPLDEISGLPIPTVGAASTTAVNIVLPYVGDRNTGPITIKLMPEDISAYDAIKAMEAIDFDEDGKCIWTTRQTGSAFRNVIVTARPASNFADIAANYSQLGGNTFSFQWTGQIARHITNNGTITNNRGYGNSQGIGHWKTYNPSPSQIYPTFAGENILITHDGNAGNAPIILIDKKSLFEHESPLYAHITKDYNTGWMPPETRSVLLADTDDTDLTATELITNGTESTISTSDWSTGNATISVVNTGGRNYLKIQNSGNSQAYAYQGFSTTNGKSYVISFRLHQESSSNSVACWLRMGTSGNGVNVLNVNNHGEGTYAYTFDATSGTTYASFFVTNTGTGRYNLVTDISVREVQVNDRSKWQIGGTGQGAKINGSGLTRTKVGSRSDLVYYTGWSSSNYLTLGTVETDTNVTAAAKRTNSPNNTSPEDLYEFGTGDYFMMGWFWVNYVGGGQYLIKREDNDLDSNTGDPTRHWSVWLAADLKYIAHYVGGNAYHSANNAYTNRSWTHFVTGRDGKQIKTYINGRLFQQWYSAGSSTVNMNNSHAVKIGQACNSATRLALMKFGKGFPSDRDIEKIYQEERELFTDDVNCTLYGTSNDIKANCYDDATGLYHVGTSSGRSDFSGLKRINNTTTAVTSSLSASNGLIAEQ